MNNNKASLFSLIQKRPLLAVLLVLLVVAAGLFVARQMGRTDDALAGDMATFEVKRGPLRISITEAGTIKARDMVIIKNEVEGRTSLLYLIPEGTQVKKGDLLIDLDASMLLDDQLEEEIRVENGKAAFINARESLAIVLNEGLSDIQRTTSQLKLAQLDLNKYKEKEYPNQLNEAEQRIGLAEEELERAGEELKWSEKLFEEKYISNTELQMDILTEHRKALDLELAKNNLELLKEFTYERELEQLASDVKQAEMAVERAEHEARADEAKAQADLIAREAEYERQKDRLIKTTEQLGKTNIYAPANGLVIYATSAKGGGGRHAPSREPLEEGQDIREREELIYLPTADAVKAEIAIHETNLRQVRLGLPVKITVDALPSKSFVGVVHSIAPLPDAKSSFLNPDLKLYPTDIYLESEGSDLRTGMSCQAEIIVDEYANAVYVPVQAVIRVGGVPTAYVRAGKSFEPREVEIGLDNNRMVRIISGLEAGEIVWLTPPLKDAAVEITQEGIDSKLLPGQEERSGPGGGQGVRGGGGPGERPGGGQGGRSGQGGGGQGGGGQGQRRMPPGSEDMSPEEREAMRQKMQSLSPEEREKMRQERSNKQQQQGETVQ